MSPNQLKVLASDAVQLDRHIAELSDRLKSLKERLIVEAENHESEFTVTEGGGSSWTVLAADGSAARVTFPAPKLKTSIDPKDKTGMAIISLLEGATSKLFTKEVKIRPRDGFRDLIRTVAPEKANKVLKLMTSESKPQVSFETKKE